MAKSVKNKSVKKKQVKPEPLKKRDRRSKALRKRGQPSDKAVLAGIDAATPRPPPPLAIGPGSVVLDRLFAVVMDRRNADPAVSHSARLLGRGLAKVAQKFGEEAVECLIEGVRGNHDAVVAESADVLYHLIVLWVTCGVHPEEVWAELKRREGVSGIAEKASRARTLPVAFGLDTTKIP
ncbi:MAG TPA: phosphoribosyl-ATP diphosphatase [Acetobacteraceae bacterium]|nr:phosphoribosyl-ATP diphosphatase [Acetobacteraceae bacterium]